MDGCGDTSSLYLKLHHFFLGGGSSLLSEFYGQTGCFRKNMPSSKSMAMCLQWSLQLVPKYSLPTQTLPVRSSYGKETSLSLLILQVCRSVNLVGYLEVLTWMSGKLEIFGKSLATVSPPSPTPILFLPLSFCIAG